MTDLRYRKTTAARALISNFVFVLLPLFEGTEKICEMILPKSFVIESNRNTIGIRGDVLIITNLLLVILKILKPTEPINYQPDITNW